MKINTDITFIINFNVIFNKRFFLNPRFYTYLRHVFMIIFPCPWSILDVKFQKVLILFLKILFLIVLVQNILFFHIQYLFFFFKVAISLCLNHTGKICSDSMVSNIRHNDRTPIDKRKVGFSLFFYFFYDIEEYIYIYNYFLL